MAITDKNHQERTSEKLMSEKLKIEVTDKNMKKLYKNAEIVLEDSVVPGGWLLAENNIIKDYGQGKAPESVCENGDDITDCSGRYLCPGFVDTHVHGGGGGDFRDESEEAFLAALRTHYKGGTRTIVPTLSSATKECMLNSIRIYNSIKEREDEFEDIPYLAGLHLEGPYFSQEQRGAQDPELIRNPDPEEYLEILDSTPHIKRWSIACELPGAGELGLELSKRGICASVGHSNATAEQVLEAVGKHGYSCVTHLYSGCSYLHRNGPYREGGVVEAAFLLKDLMVEVIGDGKHLPPLFLKLIYQIKGPDRICLVTDCLRPGGTDYVEGQTVFDDKEGKHQVILENGVAVMPDRKNFAGSISTTSNLVRVMVNDVGVPVYEAVRMAALNPAKMLGLSDRIGSIKRGKNADLVILDL